VDDQTIEFVYLPTEEMVADIFTKAIVGHLFYVFMYFINNPHSGGKFKIWKLKRKEVYFSGKLSGIW